MNVSPGPNALFQLTNDNGVISRSIIFAMALAAFFKS